ncbi:MAG: prepilin-type N-terminal cleavage/methylation domain-containing protein [Geopsychrobacter sp.]|nr:prepilin-type N-terminal cleavage/methylation domain-containing protein [Geopsychrobacter sp.]
MPKNSLSNEQGFTLIELLISMTIFAIGMLAIARVQLTAIKYNSSSNTRSVAVALTQRVIEDIISWDNDSTAFDTTQANVVYDLDTNSAANTLSIPGAGTYSANYNITTTLGSDLVVVSVTVANTTGRTMTMVTSRRRI